jgi:chromosome segregation ATPase
MTRVLLALLLALTAGCVMLPSDASSRALADADARARQGDYTGALEAYDAYLARYADSEDAGRARTSRTLVQQLISVRGETATLQAQLSTARVEAKALREKLSVREAELNTRTAELSSREAELSKLRPDLAARDAEITKLRAELAQRQSEVAKLREDIEKLKRIDLEIERRRR